MKFSISIIRDINSVICGDDAIVHVIDDNIMVSHKYRGHNIVTIFEGDGLMHIYESDSTDIENLKNLEDALYDTHWSIGSDASLAYYKVIETLIGE